MSNIQMVKSRDIQIQDISDHKPAFSDHHLNTEPFDNQTQISHLNNRLVQYSDGYCNCNYN